MYGCYHLLCLEKVFGNVNNIRTTHSKRSVQLSGFVTSMKLTIIIQT